MIRCGIVWPYIGTRTRLLRAFSTAFWIASGTSRALPYPTPTTPFSSPTTTSAVNEKRRPPLTTLATRLISTTRSWRSRPAGETDRSGAGMKGPGWRNRLEEEPGLASPVGQRLDAAVVLVAAAVEHRGVDAGRLGPLGEQRAGAARLVHRLEVAEIGLGPRDGGDRAARVVVDQLREDAAVGAAHGDARTLGRALHLRPHAAATPQADRFLRMRAHARLPTFRATNSPS